MSERGWRISANWRLGKTRYGTPLGGLQGSICPEGHLQFPPREICPECVAIGYHGLRQLDERPETVEIKQFEDLVVRATKNETSII
jgi:hypothetical protein